MKKLNIFLITLCLVISVSACANEPSKPLADSNTKRPPHHTDEGFKNLHTGPITKGPIGYVRMRLFGDDDFADHDDEAKDMDVAVPNYQAIAHPNDQAQITWLGHSTFLIQYQGVSVLTDPMLTKRASPVSFAGPYRLVPKPVSFEHLPKIDYIIISHNHYDHLDLETLERLPEDIQILVPLKLGAWLVEQGFSEQRLRELDWWQAESHKETTLTALPAQHWSARSLFDRNETLWASWMVDIGDLRIWFGGDTGYNEIEFKEIGEAYPGVDLALIPIGAYAPRWFMKQQHTDPYDAIKVHHDLAAKKSIGMHWGTFQLSAEPMMEPKQLLIKAVEQGLIDAGLFDTMAIGETRIVDVD